MSEFAVEPVAGESYEIRKDGQRLFRCWMGGTGRCWNIDFDPADEEEPAVHVCDLDEMIAALQALRESDVYRENEERWS